MVCFHGTGCKVLTRTTILVQMKAKTGTGGRVWASVDSEEPKNSPPLCHVLEWNPVCWIYSRALSYKLPVNNSVITTQQWKFRTCACMHACKHTHKNPHVHACTHTYMHACTHTHTHACIHTHAHTHTHTCIHTNTHMHAHTHAHTQTHTHTHTHMHTHTHSHTYTLTKYKCCI